MLHRPPDDTNVHSMATRSKTGIHKPKLFITQIDHSDGLQLFEPPTYKQASAHPQWRLAMETEYSVLQRNKTWTFVPPHPTQKVIGSKWVYHLKLRLDGSIERHEARLVGKGFLQTLGLDYFNTFSSVVKPITIRLVLFLALSNHWIMKYLDVHNAFLYGDLTEEVFLAQPQGFMDPTKPHHVRKLHKSLYGLK